jgi:hypothetical protein
LLLEKQRNNLSENSDYCCWKNNETICPKTGIIAAGKTKKQFVRKQGLLLMEKRRDNLSENRDYCCWKNNEIICPKTGIIAAG